MSRILFFLLLFFLSSSCEEVIEDNELQSKSFQSTEKTPDIVSIVLPKIKLIDSLSKKELKHVRSLRWEKSTSAGSSFLEVSAFINSDKVPQKIAEHFSEPGFGKEGKHFYYFENEQLIAVKSFYDEWIDSNTMEVVENQHYFENGKVVHSRTKRASFLDELPDKKWEKIRAEAPSLDRAFKVLQSKSPFKTTFISFIQGDNSLFILLGEPKKEDRYITALKIDHKDPIIEKLYKNPDQFKYTPLKITFKVTGGNGAPEYRVLEDIDWEE